jgi:ketol-acid reductoisomerase
LEEILENITSGKIKKSFISQFVSSNGAELKAFINFVEAQKARKSMDNAVEVKKAINFAKQWVKEAENPETKTVLNRYMSEDTLTALSVVAKELVKLDSGT